MRTSSKLLIALVMLLASLPLMRLSEWFGLGFPVGLVLSILWGIDYAAELRERPALTPPRRLALVLLSSLQAMVGLVALGCGLAMLAWVGWNLFVEGRPESIPDLFGLLLTACVIALGAGWLHSALQRRSATPAPVPGVLHFHADLFPALPHEDEALNPGILGRALAGWITEQLRDGPYAVREQRAEDVGWCLVVRPAPRLLWIGVSGACDLDWPPGGLDAATAARIPPASIEWTLQVCAETTGWRPLMPVDPQKIEAEVLMRTLRDALEATGRVRWTT
jgi:hypothetical protein